MAPKQHIIDTGFKFDAMKLLTPEEARKDFILRFFVPLALEMRDGANSFALLLARVLMNGKLHCKPVFVKVKFQNGFLQEPGYWGGSPTSATEPCRLLFERITQSPIDLVEQSDALEHAFGDCFEDGRENYTMEHCPMVAVLTIDGPTPTLRVVCKTQKGIKRIRILRSKLCTLASALIPAPKYSERIYNSLTGEWFGLCTKDSEDCCEACKKIYSSVAANNIYDDPSVQV